MTVITETRPLAELCARLAQLPYITVDTEFMRERTYWPVLCLVQVAGPDEAVGIDALAPGIDLSPLFELMANPNVLKVFHAARQDLEIFHHLAGAVPTPIFDTQVAAMVCGFGDSVSYEALASKLANARIDKSSRFTDWARRPLTEKQVQYALSDVTHLRVAYEKIEARLQKTGRTPWLAEEMAVLTSPATYQMEPRDAWRRIKARGHDRRFLAILREVAAWRESEAQRRDIPRNRVLRDEALTEIAAHAPETAERLAHTRGLGKDVAAGNTGRALLDAVQRGLKLPETEWPAPPRRRDMPSNMGPIIELLRVLLKLKSDAHDVAPKLIANAAQLEEIAADDHADIPALQGWRREIFGTDALALKNGRLALTAKGRKIELVAISDLVAAEPPA